MAFGLLSLTTLLRVLLPFEAELVEGFRVGVDELSYSLVVAIIALLERLEVRPEDLEVVDLLRNL